MKASTRRPSPQHPREGGWRWVVRQRAPDPAADALSTRLHGDPGRVLDFLRAPTGPVHPFVNLHHVNATARGRGAEGNVMHLSQEQWRVVPGWPLYEVSDHGRARRAIDTRPLNNTWPGWSLHLNRDQHGYLRILVCGPGGARKCFGIHRLVLLAFVGDPPEGTEAAHLDGNKNNNSLLNLAWVPHATNIHHKRLHGTIARGERSGAAKLTRAQAEDAIRRGRLKESAKAVGALYGVTGTAVAQIWKGQNWRELGGINGATL